MTRAPLLIEIGCEEIPARMVLPAAADLADRLAGILDRAGLPRGAPTGWGGPRRLAVRVEDVGAYQADRDDLVLGPAATAAFGPDGRPTPAAAGFARKHGVEPESLAVHETPRGRYVGLQRRIAGRSVGQILAAELPPVVSGMSFPKTMRWADGAWRWVRPVHWVLALHGDQVLPIELFGVRAAGASFGHRFLCRDPVPVEHPDRYRERLREAHVIADPQERRRWIDDAVREAASRAGGAVVPDDKLREEVADLVEWPGVVTGSFDPDYLNLPREILVTTLRHHQKCFSVQRSDGALVPSFVAVANTDRDPGGHIRRGNEWVIGGRLEDARFFWSADRRRPLAARGAELAKVVFHDKLGSYADKAARIRQLAAAIAERLGLDAASLGHCQTAAGLAKNDLVTATVGEFPELQGRVGGLMLAAEGSAPEIARAVYEHYQPAGPDDAVPETRAGAVVALADKLDTIASLIAVGEQPTGSRDPFGLRRAASGVFRIAIARRLPLSMNDLWRLVPDAETFLKERLPNHLREIGASPNEIEAVLRLRAGDTLAWGWRLDDVVARLDAIRTVRGRPDFAHLVDLTKRVDNILIKRGAELDKVLDADLGPYRETQPAAVKLAMLVEQERRRIEDLESQKRYDGILDVLAGLVAPVETFFQEVLVIDPTQPAATGHRWSLLADLRGVLTRCFDIRELAGQAERRSS
jgi:glycyl-tRNA synthetase beta chain